jgi:hypothetical protein
MNLLSQTHLPSLLDGFFCLRWTHSSIRIADSGRIATPKLPRGGMSEIDSTNAMNLCAVGLDKSEARKLSRSP